MFGLRFRHSISLMMAVVLLSLAVVSRAPQSKCRCHERKSASRTQKQDQKPCVFGQMRSLTASYVLPASVEAQESERLSFLPIIHSARDGVALRIGIYERPRARSPPLLS
jgi:hypothetical protein